MKPFEIGVLFTCVAVIAVSILAMVNMSKGVEAPEVDGREYGFALVGEGGNLRWYTQEQCETAKAFVEAQGGEVTCWPLPWKPKQPEQPEQHKH